MYKVDALLGPLNPNRQAAATAPDPRRIVVFHAEGEKGAAVCKAFIAAGVWHVRGLVRRLEGVAEVLRDMQVDVQKVDWDLPASFGQHVKDADAVFLTSDVRAIYRALRLAEPERTNTAREAAGRQLAHACRACADAGVAQIVVCAEVGEDVSGVEQAAKRWTVIRPSAPFSAVLDWLRPAGERAGADESHATDGGGSAGAPRPDAHDWVLEAPVPPDTPIPGYAAELTGKYVLAATSGKGQYDGKEIEAVSQALTPTQLAELLSNISGKRVSAAALSRDEFYSDAHRAKLGGIWGRFEVLVKGEYNPDPKASERVVPEQWDFTQWARQSAELKQLLGF